MEWIKLTAKGKTAELEAITAVMSMLDNGLMIEDYSDVTTDGVYGDLIDESILSADREHVAVSLFVPEERSLAEYIAFLRERFSTLGMEVTLSTEGMREEDWAESWKKYYKPIPLGRVTVVPAWMEYTPTGEEKIIRMDPGMAFGTGSHETTRLCLETCEKYMKEGDRILDVGCGSGILGIAALLTGASTAVGVDIDATAVRTAAENAELNGVSDRFTAICGSFTEQVEGKFDIVLANIVADAIIFLSKGVSSFMKDDAVYIMSGIIDTRAEEVKAEVSKYFDIIEEHLKGGWLCLAAKRKSAA